MTVEARLAIYELFPVGSVEVPPRVEEYIFLGKDLTSSVIRVESEHEVIRIPYLESNEPGIYKRGEQEVFVREEISEANIKERILGLSDRIEFTIKWRP